MIYFRLEREDILREHFLSHFESIPSFRSKEKLHIDLFSWTKKDLGFLIVILWNKYNNYAHSNIVEANSKTSVLYSVS